MRISPTNDAQTLYGALDWLYTHCTVPDGPYAAVTNAAQVLSNLEQYSVEPKEEKA